MGKSKIENLELGKLKYYGCVYATTVIPYKVNIPVRDVLTNV